MISSTHLGFEPLINDSLLCAAQAHSSRFGVLGHPIPSQLGNDDPTTIILLLCFLFIAASIAFARGFISRQLKNFFYEVHSEELNNVTSNEIRFELLLVLTDCLLLGIASFLATAEKVPGIFVLDTEFINIIVFSALFAGYFLSKWLMHLVVDPVFFGGKKTIQLFKVQLFITACSTALTLPLVMLLVFFDLSVEKCIFYFCSVLILNKILTFYKCWFIFFRQKGFFLQTFLYFCALEITPLLAFCGVWLMTVNNLKINF